MGGVVLVASVTSVGKCAVAPAPLNKLCSHTLYYISFSKILMKIMAKCIGAHDYAFSISSSMV